MNSPDAFQALALSASLTVKNLDASLAWYTEVMGFTIGQKFEREGRLLAVSLRAGEAQLLIGQDDGAKGADRVKGEGISLMFTTAQDVDTYAARIKGQGGVLDSEPADMFGRRAFRLKDPDGFKLTISTERKP